MFSSQQKQFTKLFIILIVLMMIVSACNTTKNLQNETVPPLPQLASNPIETFNYDIFAQNVFKNPELRFEHLGLLDGLSNSAVTCGVQDNRGVMWIGTFDGLNKFDGYQFTVFRHDPDDVNSLSDNLIYDIYADENGILWIATDQGLNQFDTKTQIFTHYFHESDNPNSLSNNVVLKIAGGQNDDLWVGTESGLNRINKITGEINQFINRSGENPIYDNLINTIHQEKDGKLWIGTQGGLTIFDPSDQSFNPAPRYLKTYFQSNNLSVNDIYPLNTGALWMGTSQGLYVISADRSEVKWYQTRELDRTSLSQSWVTSIFEDQFGLIWVGTNDGLNLYHPEKDEFIQFTRRTVDPNSLSSNQIYDIYQDTSGGLWFFTSNGINKADVTTKQFLHYHNIPDELNSLIDNWVFAIHEDRNGFLWLGTSSGLDRLDRRTNHYRHFLYDKNDPTSISDNFITTILEDSKGNLWFGTDAGGVNRYDPITEQFEHYKYNPVTTNSISNDMISMMLEDSNGTIWIGTARGMLDRLDPEKNTYQHYVLETENEVNQLKIRIRSMTEDHQGDIWLGTSYGLYRFDPSSEDFSRYVFDKNIEGSLSDDFVLSVIEDSKNRIWVGTYGGGLNLLSPGTDYFKVYTHRDGLANDTVYGIVEDEAGYLWLSTNYGLSRFNPETETFENFDVRDGVQSNEFNERAYFKSPSGEIFFGGVNGITAFYPQNIHKNPISPRVILTGLQVSGQPVETGNSIETSDSIKLKWPENHFEFTFAGLNYQQPENNQYAYYLKGFDKNWNLNGNLRFGRYTNLPGGSYTLYLSAANEDGVWNQDWTELDVLVIPPIWETPLFQVALGLMVLFIGVGGYLLKMRGVQVRNRELELLVEERTAEIEQRREVAEGLKDVLFLLNSNKTLQESLDFIIRAASQLTNADHVLLLSIQEEPVTYVTVRGSQRSESALQNELRLRKEESPEFTNWLGELAKQGQVIVVENIPQFIIQRKEKHIHPYNYYYSMLIFPIMSTDDLYGSLVFLYINKQEFGDEFVSLAESFAEQAALAIGNAQLRDRVQQIAIVSERNRLARDLHDAVTQTLFSASLIAEALPTLFEKNPADGKALLQELRQLSRGALAEMRTLLLELRPSAVIEAKMYDLVRQLTESAIGRTGMDIDFQVNLPKPLPDDVHVSMYRITQEALNNVVKHSHAKSAEVIINGVVKTDQEQEVIISIRDDGSGFDPNQVSNGHFGLNIIRERVNNIGGQLMLKSETDCGTLIKVVWCGRAKEDE
jgi:ligand-binding sensor domain-containing protein/signal transduction histidine kinase